MQEIFYQGSMLIFEIHSIPRPQRKTQWNRNRAYDPSFDAKESIRWQLRPHAPKELLRGPLHVNMHFYLPIPKITKKHIRAQMINGIVLPYKRPDLDNLAYLVTNAMIDIVYIDDSQIVNLNLRKRYAEIPKTVIEVQEL